MLKDHSLPVRITASFGLLPTAAAFLVKEAKQSCKQFKEDVKDEMETRKFLVNMTDNTNR